VIILAVLAGGMIGAPARYLVDRAIQARRDTVFPWGTLAVNLAGSLVIGFLLGAQRHLALPPAAFALLGTGLCGGLTTFSTFSYETLRLLEDGSVSEAGLNIIGSLALGVLLAWLGYLFAGVLLLASPDQASQRSPVELDAVTAARIPAPVCQTA
jgi:fluoride exporter